MNILIKEIKGSFVAKQNNEYGFIDPRTRTFVSYSEEQLKIKTAYKQQYGYRQYDSIDSFFKEQEEIKALRLLERADFERKRQENKELDKKRLQSLIEAGPIKATVENIRLILSVLNEQNWGSWNLPQMTIAYSANQYDCDGKTASTIILDTPISDDEYSIKNETHFVIGAPRGHLNKYYRL